MSNMEKLATENLFLLEFLVDDVKMSEKCDCDAPPGELCVSFQFLDNDPLDVCEADFTPNRKYGDNGNIKSGKSCLFSLTPDQVHKSTEVFDVVISVFKKMQPGWLPEKICIGSALVSISNLFVELIQSVELSTEETPSAKTLKDTFDLSDTTGTNVGKISIYIRMSCFGKLIVTQFQMNLEDKSVLFKDKGGQSLYRYKKAKKNDETKIEDVPSCKPLSPNQPDMSWNMQCPTNPCFGGDPQFIPQGSPQSTMFPPGAMMPCSECNMMQQMAQQQQQQRPACLSPEQFNSQMLTPCIECGQFMGQPFGDEQPSCPPQPQDPPGNYQEIGATMGGNALTIRVHKDKNKIEQVDAASTGSSCCCSPGNIGARKSSLKKPAAAMPTSQQQCQSLDVRPGIQQGDKNLPFSFKMCGNGGATDNNVIINPPVGSKPDGTKYTEISDPNKEVFVLRIGKKSEGVQKKANLELELCTPRGPEIKPIPKKETRDSQYDASDCKDGGGGGKGKGKGKKGGKGGKKGKKKK